MSLIDYASPSTKAPKSNVLLVLAMGVAAGCLGANPFADAVGMSPVSDAAREPGNVVLRMLCGLVVGFVAMVLTATALREGNAVSRALHRIDRRPPQAIAITLIICGTACLLGALAIPLFAIHTPGGVRIVATSNGMAASADLPAVAQILAVLTFLAGAVLIALGIWSSTPAPADPVARPLAPQERAV